MHCVLYGHPSLDAVVRTIPSNEQIKAALNNIKANKRMPVPATSRKRRRADSLESMAATIGSMAEASSSTQPIVVQDRVAALADDATLINLETATKVTSTVTCMKALKRKIIVSNRNIFDDDIEKTRNIKGL